MLEQTIKKYIGNVSLGDFFTVIMFLTFIGILLFGLWGLLQANPNQYNECIMGAIDKIDRSADVITLCKELK